jgi:hypothetical protein
MKFRNIALVVLAGAGLSGCVMSAHGGYYDVHDYAPAPRAYVVQPDYYYVAPRYYHERGKGWHRDRQWRSHDGYGHGYGKKWRGRGHHKHDD